MMTAALFLLTAALQLQAADAHQRGMYWRASGIDFVVNWFEELRERMGN